MNEQYEEVVPAELHPGDVVHVSFNSGSIKRIYLNEKVEEDEYGYVATESGRSFHIPYSRFYLVQRAKKPLPTELGAVVEHTDGWKFVRVGEDDWIGISPSSGRSTMHWSDSEVDSAARKVEA